MEHADRLLEEARLTNERRMLVLAGEAATTRRRAADALEGSPIGMDDVVSVGSSSSLPGQTVEYGQSTTLLGSTWKAVVLDCHQRCEPNLIGQLVGAVDGGGLFVVLTPPLEAWPEMRDSFDETLAPPPHEVTAVGGQFKRHLVRTVRDHPGVAIVDVDGKKIETVGLTDPPPRMESASPSIPAERQFAVPAYEACLTQDQIETLATLERLTEAGNAVVVEANRGRGKSSVAGLAAACLADSGQDVLVTAPQFRNVRELFARTRECKEKFVAETEQRATDGRKPPDPSTNIAFGEGSVRYEPPEAAKSLPGGPDRVLVDEAAALPLSVLRAVLAAESVAFTTTVHGYEGAGRGFSVRFKAHLEESRLSVTTHRMAEPIRYAAGDPIEVWSFRALALDARPAVGRRIEAATPDSVAYRTLRAEDLLADEQLLREVFGLLVLAHYRTEPNDLARLLDGPNISVHALEHEGHPVSVALVAREGGLPESIRQRMYRGERVRGHMIPDVLAGQLRDPDAAIPEGDRILRIATHHAVRSRGLGSLLVETLREHHDGDWLGVGYGATPSLLRFWCKNGFRTIHVATSRNDRSGEHSVLMLDPQSPAGVAVLERHSGWFLQRFPDTLSDALAGLEPDVVRAVLPTVAGSASLDLHTLDVDPLDARIATGIPSGAAILATAPRSVRRLTIRHLRAPNEDVLSVREERLLVRKVLQCQPWEAVAEALEYPSQRTCMQAVGAAVESLVRAYGTEEMIAEIERLQ